jgi:hypothetical protein
VVIGTKNFVVLAAMPGACNSRAAHDNNSNNNNNNNAVVLVRILVLVVA